MFVPGRVWSWMRLPDTEEVFGLLRPESSKIVRWRGLLVMQIQIETGLVLRTVRGVWQLRGWRVLRVAFVACGLVTLCGVGQMAEETRPLFIAAIGVRQSDHLWLVLVRSPLSIFASATVLPSWNSLLEIVLVCIVCEVFLGTWRMIAISVASQLVVNLIVHVVLIAGYRSRIGLRFYQLQDLDTGPSAVIVALGIAAATRARTVVFGAVVASWTIAETLAHPGSAGREHVLALLLGPLLLFVSEHRIDGVSATKRRSEVDGTCSDEVPRCLLDGSTRSRRNRNDRASSLTRPGVSPHS